MNFRVIRSMIVFAAIITIIMTCADITIAKPRQLIPDLKRQMQIRKALIDSGYQSGRTWPETQIILKQIAREHGWQSRRAPDARVLILLGLGNKHSNPEILNYPDMPANSILEEPRPL